MGDVYSNAVCCVAATASKNGNEGLFRHRQPEGLTSVQVRTTWSQTPGFPASGSYWCGCHIISPITAIEKAPLNQRAWVAQERFLSLRIMHFSAETLFWECQEALTNEAQPDGDLYLHEGSDRGTRQMKRFVQNYQTTASEASAMGYFMDKDTVTGYIDPYEAWCIFRNEYSLYSLTKETDFFVALSGIMTSVSRAINDQLIAGHWKARFLEDICWSSMAPKNYVVSKDPKSYRPSTWRAPSWSWASTLLPVRHSESLQQKSWYGKPVELATVVDISANTKISGELTDASLTLTCRLIPAGRRVRSPDYFTGNFMPSMAMEDSLPIHFDNYTPRFQQMELYLLNLWHTRRATGPYIEGIALMPVENQAGCFQRVGHFNVMEGSGIDDSRHVLISLLAAHGQLEDRTITIL